MSKNNDALDLAHKIHAYLHEHVSEEHGYAWAEQCEILNEPHNPDAIDAALSKLLSSIKPVGFMY